ncbi:MAG TPA: nickel-dependent hydrogenase large subunit [Solirubrobacter sp.]|nr:nickel-dependent hydrogenase large subunit [Solirubrobacter sp.]
MSWRDEVSAALAGGARFAGAWASGDVWRAAFVDGDGVRVLSCPAARAESIVDLVPAAGWDEREAHDLHGLAFPGRPLVDHTAPGWATPVTGDGVHEVAVGPIHAGVIESGHFRFHTVGDRVLVLDVRLFYKHRGLEAAARGRDVADGLAYAQRACAACAVANSVAYAQAVEDALGLAPDRDLRVARTLALELERLYNHLHDIGALCAGVGFAAGTMAFAALKERAQRLNARLCGHRFLFGTVRVGAGGLAVDEPAAARAEVRALRAEAAAGWRDLEFATSVQARLDGVGVLAPDDAVRLGATGPAARASGVRSDARSHAPRLWYGDFVPARPREETGDVAARLQVRAAELEATCELLDELLAAPVAAGRTRDDGSRGGAGARDAVLGRGAPSTRDSALGRGAPSAPDGALGRGAPSRDSSLGRGAGARDSGLAIGVGRVESPRGATLCAVEVAGGTVARLRLRTASYANWPAVAHAAAGCLLPDFPLINKSFELCYACVDR